MHPLTYDHLPPHSRVRREYVDGVLKISAAAEEPGPLVRRAALRQTALPAALMSAVALLIGCISFGSTYLTNRRFMPSGLSTILLIALVVFIAALFTFAWRMRYVTRIYHIERLLQQTTVLAVGSGRLLIESAGPLGTISHDFPHDSVQSIRLHRNREKLLSIQICLKDSGPIDLLIGRDELELDWIVRAIRSALQK